MRKARELGGVLNSRGAAHPLWKGDRKGKRRDFSENYKNSVLR